MIPGQIEEEPSGCLWDFSYYWTFCSRGLEGITSMGYTGCAGTRSRKEEGRRKQG